MATQEENQQTPQQNMPQPQAGPPDANQPLQPTEHTSYTDVPPPPENRADQAQQPPVQLPSPPEVPRDEREPRPPEPSAPGGTGPGAPEEQEPPKEGFLGKLPWKAILAGVGAIFFTILLVFLVRRFILPQAQQPEEITLTYWGLWEESPIIEKVIADFEAQNEQVKINYIKQSKEDYRERLVSTLAKGTGPDIFRFHNTWVPMLSQELAVLPPEIIPAGAYQQTFYPVAGETLRQGANLVGIPLMYDGLALYINKDLFAASGQSVPITWDELRKAASALTVKDEQGRIQQAGVAMAVTQNVDHWQDILALMMLQNGADLADPTGEFARDAIKFFTLFATDDKVWDETLPSSTQAFAAGKLAMYFGPSWRAFEIKKANPALSFEIVPVPQLPKTGSAKEVTWASFWAEGVWSGSKNQEEAWQFLKYLSSKSALQQMYQEAAKVRLFGEPYPRQDMAELLLSDPFVGAYIKQAPNARSWYLASRTFDGPTGINSAISAYYADAVNAIVNDDKEPDAVLPTVAQGVREVLSRYSLQR